MPVALHQHATPHTQRQTLRQLQLQHPSAKDPPSNGSLAIDYPTFIELDPKAVLQPKDQTTITMQSDTWGAVPQLNAKLGRASHQRDSSLSSLGSVGGPASPFNQTTSNPQIAMPDYRTDGLPELSTQDIGENQNNFYQLAKSMGNFPGYQNLDQALPEMAYPVTIPGPVGKPRVTGALQSAPDFSSTSTRSHPPSVASSIAGDSPATPTHNDYDNGDRRKKAFNNPPRLDRTISDVYGDELYNPNFAITSASPPQPQLSASPVSNDVFNQRLSAANSQHLSVTHSPKSNPSRERSPFRTDSPLVQPVTTTQNSLPFNTAQRIREQAKARQEANPLQQQMNRSREPDTPTTISPKDAVLEFSESDGDANFPLFPPESSQFELDQLAKVMLPQQNGATLAQNAATNQAGNGIPNLNSYLTPQMPMNLQLPQQYSFMGRQQSTQDTPPRLSSAGSSSADSVVDMPTRRARPARIGADGGTYTCTYHGCTLRFETPALLQKHKREGHRQTQGLGIPSRSDGGMTSSLLNSQAGPHRCDRINPSTGKPCGTVFSRPYDLTRHEDTIHNARKLKVRCDLCTEEKTFSRADALTRHYRVCHPDVELPGKHRRRNGI